MYSRNHSSLYDDYYKAINREESSLLNHNNLISDQQIPTTSNINARPVILQPLVTITTPNGEHQKQIPQKSDTEIIIRSPNDLNGLTSYQYYTRLTRISSDEQRLDQTDEYQFNIDVVKDLRWIHWRMTLFVFYWIVWFIGLILVIIVVAYRAKS